MRRLVVDVGNTSTAVGLWTDGRVSNVSHCDSGFDEGVKLPLLAEAASSRRRYATLAYVSVVPKADAKWRRWARSVALPFHQISYKDITESEIVKSVKSSNRKILTLDYPHPETIGADRLCDAAAAVTRYGAPVIVMDFGTALTAAAITSDRVWRGGVIAPGFPLMRDYLFERTAKLPRMELGRGVAPKIGRSTEEAMRFGALVGYRGMVREIVTTLRRNFHEDFRLVATGGFARWALKGLDLDFTIDPTLTLAGAGMLGK